jgi:hypothetical protein
MDLRGAGARDRRMREARGLASESLGADTVNGSFSRRTTPYETEHQGTRGHPPQEAAFLGLVSIGSWRSTSAADSEGISNGSRQS